MKLKTLAVVLSGMTIGSSFAEILPAFIDPNNPTKLATQAGKPLPQPSKVDVPKVSSPSNNIPTLTPNTLIDVRHIVFIGGTRYPLQELIQPYTGVIGQKVPLSTLITITNTITQRYQKDGYVLSYAYLPADNFHNGNVQVGLVEGYIANTRIQSDNAAVGGWLTKLSKRIMEEKPLTQKTFERYSILMSRTPDTKVTASAAPPNNIFGAAEMVVDAKHPRNWDVNTTFDSRKGESLAFVNATFSGFSNYGEQLAVSTLVPLDKSTRKSLLGLNYQQYVNDSGLLMQIKGSFVQQNPDDYTTILTTSNGISLDAKEKQTQYNGGVAFSYPLMLTRQQQWTVNGELDYLDKRYDYKLRVRNATQQAALPDANFHTRYPAAEFSLNGYREYTQSYWSTRFGIRQGINDFGATNTNSPADLSFTSYRWNGEAAYLFDKKWRLSTSLEGDWTDNTLPEPERVSFGAQRYGRGYPDGEASGDYGYGGQIEMRYLHNREQGEWLKTVQPYVLMDTAHTQFNQSGLPTQNLASYAVGVMLGDSKHYSLTFEGARPIADLPSDSNRRDWRFSATFTYNFRND
ncbi:MAG: ShlB/FhaC/HecB family hemolysin secretion/activation protein [Hafnia sp.]|uniref:ShlB/FhaC/HecB family hemolysin secretion/activation protein n=1 Tax=Hafnia sp. TaxID=1873498 RepID=UPI002FCA9B76